MDTHKVIVGGFMFAVCLSLVIPTLGASFTVCPAGQYRDKNTGSCEICSKCPMNEIVRRPCSQYRDTSCGPFYEFEFFHQGKDDSEHSKGSHEENEDFNLFKFYSTKEPLLSGEEKGSHAQRTENVKVDEQISVSVPYLKDDAPRWRELCYGLIAALTIVTVLFIFYVAYTQVQMRKINDKCKLASMHDTREEPIYCYTQMFTADDQSESSKHKASGSRSPVYKPGHATRMNSSNARALPNEYVIHMREANPTVPETLPEQNQLLPIIPEGSSSDSDHVRVLYTNQK